MTYEDFVKLANNPPHKEQEYIYVLSQYTIDALPDRQRQHYPEYEVSRQLQAYFKSREEAEAFMNSAAVKNDLADITYCFYLREYPLNKELYNDDECTSCRVYDASGMLVEHSLCSNVYDADRHYYNFLGRPQHLIRFNEGDIVEVFNGKSVSLAIVVGTPPTPQRMWEIRKRTIAYMTDVYKLEPDTDNGFSDALIEKHYCNDDSDDSYIVIDGPGYEYHSHPHSTCVFHPHFSIPPYIRRRFEGYYLRMLQKELRNSTNPEDAARYGAELAKRLYPDTYKKPGE